MGRGGEKSFQRTAFLLQHKQSIQQSSGGITMATTRPKSARRTKGKGARIASGSVAMARKAARVKAGKTGGRKRAGVKRKPGFSKAAKLPSKRAVSRKTVKNPGAVRRPAARTAQGAPARSRSEQGTAPVSRIAAMLPPMPPPPPPPPPPGPPDELPLDWGDQSEEGGIEPDLERTTTQEEES